MPFNTLSIKPDIVVINHGANDRGAPAEEYIARYEELVDMIFERTPNAIVVCLGAFCGAFDQEIGEFAEKNENFKIKGGIMEGAAISVDEVVKLSKMPNREQLLCMLLYALNGNISGLARALQAVADQKNEATPA